MASSARTDMQALCNVDMEREVLGAVLVKPDKIFELAGVLKPDDFYRETHRAIYRAMLSMAGKRAAIDIQSLVEELKAHGELDRVGGIAAVSAIGQTFTAAHLMQHVATVKDYARRRALLAVADGIAEKAKDLSEDVDLSSVQSVVADAASGAAQDIRPMRDEMIGFMACVHDQSQNGDNGVLTGIESLDTLTRGFRPADLVILAARPSMGKSALALAFALAAALKYGKRVAYFSLEMSKHQLVSRMAASISGVDSQRIASPKRMDESDWTKLIRSTDILAEAPLYLLTERIGTPLAVYGKARQVQGKYGLDMVVIDHIHLMTSGRQGDAGNRVQEMSYISRQLKLMAMELGVPVLALAQLSRGVESRQDKHPQLSDLRDSGSIEQDADLVMMLYRASYYSDGIVPEGAADPVELSIKKFRNGPLGKVGLNFYKEVSRFTEMPFGGVPVSDKDIPV
ncbi:replicative DNA helicase [uncultured Mitsuokella sp.]|uniref:replicative DNA helicase n=1 Tax=uncultured Mitsuokella sp. TaxID=453120 RepID=UPI00262A42F4|nr:replicative DNA helicase [uncultured Mitsuokella sp.]